jgi:hypothetical protein
MGDSSRNGIDEFRLELYGIREVYSGEVLVTYFNIGAILTRCLNMCYQDYCSKIVVNFKQQK